MNHIPFVSRSLSRAIGVVAATVCFLGGAADSLGLERGPYLQSGTPESVTVRWRTEAERDSRVWYGSDPANLTESVIATDLETEHEVEIDGLTPDTIYYYAVGGAEEGDSPEVLAGGDAEHFVLTHPPVGEAKPTRVWVLGDSGTANSDARAVRNAYEDFTGDNHTDLWLMLGDNAYDDGTDEDFQAAVFDMYPEMLRKSVLWSTRGNHEQTSNGTGSVYYDLFTFPVQGEAGGVPSGSEAYYSFDYGNIHFICLDSQGTSLSPDGAMATWLTEDLAAHTGEWTIAFFHHPPYSKGSHDSDDSDDSGGRLEEMRENFLPILEAGGVDVVLTGHSHSYERSYLLDGHYGRSDSLEEKHLKDDGDGREDGSGVYWKPAAPAPNEGAVYVVAGSSGKAKGSGSLDHPAMYISLKELGSLVMDFDGNRLDVIFLDSAGETRDYFTIVKEEAGGSPPEIDPSSLHIERDGGHIVLTWDEEEAQLETASELTGPWSVVEGATSPYTVDAGSSPRYFFRLRMNE